MMDVIFARNPTTSLIENAVPPMELCSFSPHSIDIPHHTVDNE